MTEEALKPCPFCGSTHTFTLPLRGLGFVVACGNCTARIETNTEAEAITAWNQRTTSGEANRLAVTDEMIEAALHAPVPGGSQVWVWLPQQDGWTPHQTARDVMRCALEAALRAQPDRPADVVEAIERPLRSALRFAASRSAITAEEERAILAALSNPATSDRAEKMREHADAMAAMLQTVFEEWDGEPEDGERYREPALKYLRALATDTGKEV